MLVIAFIFSTTALFICVKYLLYKYIYFTDLIVVRTPLIRDLLLKDCDFLRYNFIYLFAFFSVFLRLYRSLLDLYVS